MNICTKRMESWLSHHPKIRQWVWFIVLWCGGLFTVLAFAYPIKWLMQVMAAHS